ncbi:hypothetical protein P5V15_011636 [Pogonomyrmex californicus]
MERHTSLRVAMERAIAVKIIKENSFPKFQERDRKGKISFEFGHERNFLNKGEIFARDYKQNRGKFSNFNSKQKETSGPKREANECWQCGAKGHFRTECLSLVNSGKGNLSSPSFAAV